MSSLLARIVRPATRPASPFGPDAIEVGPRALRVGDGLDEQVELGPVISCGPAPTVSSNSSDAWTIR